MRFRMSAASLSRFLGLSNILLKTTMFFFFNQENCYRKPRLVTYLLGHS